MVDLRPFRGVRYDNSRVGRDLSSVVCPPYDVISPQEQTAFFERDARNVIRLELPRESATEPGVDRYQRAADQYRRWLAEGTLKAEAAPAFYASVQEFSLFGATHQRRGVVGAMRLEAMDTGLVRPHEQTLPGPKQDRLELMRACLANFSPIWCLYQDDSGATSRFWQALEAMEPDLEATDADGTRHRVWVVADPSPIQWLREGLLPGPVYIADGHHRYETALRYQLDLGGEHSPADAALNFVLTYLVESSDPGLFVLGTHRILRLQRELGQDALFLRRTLDRWFEVTEHAGTAAELVSALESAGDRPGFGVWAPALGIRALVRLRGEGGVPTDVAPGRSAAWRNLDLAALHRLVIDEVCAGGASALVGAGRLRYSRLLEDVEGTLERGEAVVAFLVRRSPVAQVIAVADAGDLMPEKSTYFHPKPVTGLVIASLEGELSALA